MSATQLGIFKKHGLDLKIIDFGGGSKMAQAMAAGAIDIGDGAGTEMAFVAKGAPMIAVCESTAPAPFLGVGVPWDSPIKSLAESQGQDHRRLELRFVQRLVRPRAGAHARLGRERRDDGRDRRRPVHRRWPLCARIRSMP